MLKHNVLNLNQISCKNPYSGYSLFYLHFYPILISKQNESYINLSNARNEMENNIRQSKNAAVRIVRWDINQLQDRVSFLTLTIMSRLNCSSYFCGAKDFLVVNN